MKILFNTYPTAFQNPGGGEVIILKLKEYLEKKGHSVDLFNQWEHKISEYDLVHEFSLLSWRNWNYYKLEKRPFVLTPTSWIRTSKSYKLKYYAKEKFKIFLSNNGSYPSLINEINLPDMICPTTQLESERMISFYGDDLAHKTKVIHNGIDIIDVNKVDTSEFIQKFKPKENFLIFVGSLRPNKNVEVAIEMAKSLSRQIFIIGSDSKDFSEYFQKIKKYESEDVVFTGYIKNGSNLLAAAYKLASAIIIPSDFETCSLVGLEAGCFGTPSFITKYGGTKEIYKNHATYIDPKNIDQCVKSIQELNSEKNSVLQEFVQENYSWEKITNDYLKVYEKVTK